jgi:hypothetical protein
MERSKMEAAHPTGWIVAVLKQNKIGAQAHEEVRVADRIVQRFRETGIQCELRDGPTFA